MQDTEVATPAPLPPPPPRRARVIALAILLVAIAFLAGYVPKALEARRVRAELSRTDLDLRLANLHRQLGIASHEAQRNNYYAATNAARVFFDGCANIARSEAFLNQPRTKAALGGYAAQRDSVLAQLSTGDPASKERLAGLYLAMDGVLQRKL